MDHRATSLDTLALQIRLAARRLHLSTEFKFNPDQPRVPAGNPDGGQWTGGGGSSSGRASGSSPRYSSRDGTQPNEDPPLVAWRRVGREVSVDGSGEQTRYKASDGTKILTERRTGLATGTRTSRHIVQMPDGGGLLVDNDKRGVQRIYDADGALISASRWGPNGPEPVAVVQPAHDTTLRPPRGLGEATARLMQRFQAGVALFGQLAQETGSGLPVISFRAREYVGSHEKNEELELVGRISEPEIEQTCKEYRGVRDKTTEYAVLLRPLHNGKPKEFGTAVHTAIKRDIDALNRYDLKAEQSITKSTHEFGEQARKKYGTAGTLRIDVYELVENTVCVYDIKTGKSGLTMARISEIADATYRLFPSADRFLVIEVRPN